MHMSLDLNELLYEVAHCVDIIPIQDSHPSVGNVLYRGIVFYVITVYYIRANCIVMVCMSNPTRGWHETFSLHAHWTCSSKNIRVQIFMCPVNLLQKPCKADVYFWENKHMPCMKNHLPSRAHSHKGQCALGQNPHATGLRTHLNVKPCLHTDLRFSLIFW